MHNKQIVLNWTVNQLWNGCILASIAHAIMAAHYPEFSYEQSWDGKNYNIQDGARIRGTITFKNNNCVAAFRNDKSIRTSIKMKNVIDYFDFAPDDIINLALSETLEYLYENVNGHDFPLITTAFWGYNNILYSNDSYDDLLSNGFNIILKQTLDIESAINEWKSYYNMSTQQIKLLRIIYKKRIMDVNKVIYISDDEIKMIGSNDKIALNESYTSFRELKIIKEST